MTSTAPAWQLRLLGGGVGAVVPAALMLITIPTVFLAIIAGFGIPVGVIVGAMFGPRLVTGPRGGHPVLKAGGTAFLVGSIGYACAAALAAGRYATPLDLLAYAVQAGLLIALYVGIFSVPMALFAAWLGAGLLRRLARYARWLWAPSLLLAAGVLVVTVAGLVQSAQAGGDQAAQMGDSIAFEYLVVYERDGFYWDPGYSLEVRSYWHGKVSGGSSSGAVGPCSSGNDWIQASDWALWIASNRNQDWEDRPTGKPLVTSAEFPGKGPVQLTITIAPDGSVTWQRGIIGSC